MREKTASSKNPAWPALMSKPALLAAVLTAASVGLGGCGAFGGDRESKEPELKQSEIGVNAFLWRASLDTLAFMPLKSADPFGGVIITEWYANPEKADERFMATVYILDTRLRADGLKVALSRQVQRPDGQWSSAPVDPQTSLQIENAILTRARQLRIAALPNAD